MKVYTRVEIDIETGAVLGSESYEYDGPVAECKGDGTSKDVLKEQQKLQQDAYNNLLARQNQVSGAVSKYLSGNVGFDPAQLAALRTQFLNQNAQAFNTAGQNVRTALLRSGSMTGTAPLGGDAVRGIAGLQGAEANNVSQGLTGINLQNLQQMLANQFNAASLINGQAAQLASPINSFTGGIGNALSNYVQASNTGFGNSFANSFGRALGNTLGGGNVSFSGTKQF